jgi:hypothetical protein
MFAIKVLALLQSYEKLGAIRVGAAISHREDACMRVSSLERLILEALGLRVDTVATRSVTFSDIATLYHEAFHDSMDSTA